MNESGAFSARVSSEKRRSHATNGRYVRSDADRLGIEISRSGTPCALVVGQDEGIEQIVNVYQTCLSGLISPGRPIGNFLFLGPTGSGKTRIVEATAESLARNPRADVFLPSRRAAASPALGQPEQGSGKRTVDSVLDRTGPNVCRGL
jgi:predicted Ser/Thr protein kinase